jgi:hypothetical protein
MRQGEIIEKVLRLTFGLVLSGFILAGCTKEKRDNPIVSSGGGNPGSSNLSDLQSEIFALGCATSGCHDNRATPAGNLNMSNATQSYNNLVNRNSTQATSLKLVLPNNPGSSYLINKLQGTHLAVGGSGVRMPQFAAPLSSEDMDRIIDWINNGAPLN